MTRAEQRARRERMIAAVLAGELVSAVAAREGLSTQAVYAAAKCMGVTLPKEQGKAALAEAMRRLHADPEFKAANAERAAEAMRRMHADPEFRAAHAERMRRMHADPEFRAANAERMRRMHADPEFRAAHAERMRRLNAARRGFAIPAWVDAAGLRGDYMDAAAEHGEEYAASLCRALKRGMLAPPPHADTPERAP